MRPAEPALDSTVGLWGERTADVLEAFAMLDRALEDVRVVAVEASRGTTRDAKGVIMLAMTLVEEAIAP